MGARKPWREMTEKEIAQGKRAQCRWCSYSSAGGTSGISSMTCDYIGVTGHRRPCLPGECAEKGVFRPKDGKRRGKGISLSPKKAKAGAAGRGGGA